MAAKSKSCCMNLRPFCFMIAYLNLFAVVVDIVCHIIVVAIVTRGFQCDVDEYSIRDVDWPWVEQLLVVINVGTHGFYPFPLAPRNYKMNYLNFLRPGLAHTPPRCYPGMVHIYLIDILNFMINLMWLSFVKSYMVAVHKKDHNKMGIFFIVSVVKVSLQIIYFEYYPGLSFFGTSQSFWTIKIFDICLATSSLFIIHEYRMKLKEEARRAAVRRLEQPPAYIDCIFTGPYQVKPVAGSSKDDKLPVVTDEIDKLDIEVITIAQDQPADSASRS